MSARSIQNGSSLGIPSPRPDSLRTDHGTLKSPPLLIKFGGLAEATAISMPDAESATSALRCPKQLLSLPLPASTRPRCSSWLRASAAPTRALAFNTLMLGHYRSPTARSTAPFRCSCCHSLPISSMLPLRCAVWSGPVGQVTAAVCDQFGGKAGFSVVVGHRSRARSYRRTAARPVFVTDRAGEVSAMWHQAGLVQVGRPA